MRLVDEFRQRSRVEEVVFRIKQVAVKLGRVCLMEVCGTHTHNFYRFGLNQLLPPEIELLAGPGCPVCVSPNEYIDGAIALARQPRNIVATFADMLRVPGTESTLEKERAKGARIQIVYSPLEALNLAEASPKNNIIFLGVGFETTAPTVALTVLQAKKKRLKNLFFYNSLKLMPPVMQALLKERRLGIQGFLCPGHVSVVIGVNAYEFIPRRYKIPCCVAGFEPLDILEGIYLLLRQILKKSPCVDNQYIRAVTRDGNPYAQRIIAAVFCRTTSHWRGLGRIPLSGLALKKGFSDFDAVVRFSGLLRKGFKTKKSNCSCPEVLKGLIKPAQCRLFKRVCTPENPQGPCMVSQEGACYAYFRYAA